MRTPMWHASKHPSGETHATRAGAHACPCLADSTAVRSSPTARHPQKYGPTPGRGGPSSSPSAEGANPPLASSIGNGVTTRRRPDGGTGSARLIRLMGRNCLPPVAPRLPYDGCSHRPLAVRFRATRHLEMVAGLFLSLRAVTSPATSSPPPPAGTMHVRLLRSGDRALFLYAVASLNSCPAPCRRGWARCPPRPWPTLRCPPARSRPVDGARGAAGHRVLSRRSGRHRDGVRHGCGGGRRAQERGRQSYGIATRQGETTR